VNQLRYVYAGYQKFSITKDLRWTCQSKPEVGAITWRWEGAKWRISDVDPKIGYPLPQARKAVLTLPIPYNNYLPFYTPFLWPRLPLSFSIEHVSVFLISPASVTQSQTSSTKPANSQKCLPTRNTHTQTSLNTLLRRTSSLSYTTRSTTPLAS